MTPTEKAGENGERTANTTDDERPTATQEHHSDETATPAVEST